MAAIAITNELDALKQCFDNPGEVYFSPTPTDDIAALATVDYALPVIQSQALINTGEATINRTKLIDSQTWCSYPVSGDPDISLQVASVKNSITDLFMNKAGAAITMTNTINGKTYAGQGYSLAVKKVKGTLLYVSMDKSFMILLPNVSVYASFNAGGDTAAYFDLAIDPMPNADGVSIAFLPETTTP